MRLGWILLCKYIIWQYGPFLNSKFIIFPTQSCLVLYSFWTPLVLVWYIAHLIRMILLSLEVEVVVVVVVFYC